MPSFIEISPLSTETSLHPKQVLADEQTPDRRIAGRHTERHNASHYQFLATEAQKSKKNRCAKRMLTERHDPQSGTRFIRCMASRAASGTLYLIVAIIGRPYSKLAMVPKGLKAFSNSACVHRSPRFSTATLQTFPRKLCESTFQPTIKIPLQL